MSQNDKKGDRHAEAGGHANAGDISGNVNFGDNVGNDSRTMHTFNVAGAQGSNVTNSHVAGVVHGGMGNRSTTNDNRVDRSVNAGAVSGNIATGDNATNRIGTEAKPRDTNMSNRHLVDLLKEHECSDDVIQKFENAKITGRIFFSNADEIIESLDITSKFEIMKLKTLIKDVKQ